MRYEGLIAAAALLLPVAARAAETGAAARIGGYNDGIVAIMKAGLPLKARADRFQPLVTGYYDMPGIAALVIGPAWGAASAADRSAVTAALTRHSAVALAQNFARYGGERFLVDPKAQLRGDGAIVKTVIASRGGSETLYFRMRQAGGGWKIVDVLSGGVSQLAVQRADLAATASAGGLPAVVRKLGEVDARTLGGR